MWRRAVAGRPPPKPEGYAANRNPHIPAILKRARRFFEISQEMIEAGEGDNILKVYVASLEKSGYMI